ncbi:hypothetical protein TWF694_007989 [Orbilia ellipsospora]|uniref:Ankyrin repeat protein n=1 Tax=Orbilia ellipsospora TaxID=2528407 RepID=A0AAV9XER5_9PEZI
MADPISVIGIVASVVRTTASTIQNLYQLQQRFSGATNTQRNIIRECEILQIAVTQIQSWIEGIEANGQSNSSLQSLSHSLQGFLPSLQSLDNEVTRMLGRVGPGESLGFRASASFTWNEDVMRSHLADIRWHANALHFLLTATSLSAQTSPNQPRSRNSANFAISPTSNINLTNIPDAAADTSSSLASPTRVPAAGSTVPQNIPSNRAFEVSLSAFEAGLLTAKEIQMLSDISTGLRPLHQRVGADRLTAIQIAAKAGQSAFHYAVQFGNPNVLRALLPEVVKSAQAVAEYGDNDGLILFHIAARYRRIGVVQALISLFGPLTPKKLALTSKSQDYTPFLEAVSAGYDNMCHLLLHNGSKLVARTKINGTALHIAAKTGQESVVPLLISCNIYVDWIDQNGEIAIRIAAARGFLSTVKSLINADTKHNRKNYQGKIVLHLAAEYGHAAVVEFLLKSGAKREIPTRNGEMIVEFACISSSSNKEVVKLLGITSQQEGISCLFCALCACNYDIVAYLLSTTYVDASA